jgi:hypothetical protein
MKITPLFIMTWLLKSTVYAQQKTDYKFSFGPKEVPVNNKVDPFETFTLPPSPHSPVIITPGIYLRLLAIFVISTQICAICGNIFFLPLISLTFAD